MMFRNSEPDTPSTRFLAPETSPSARKLTPCVIDPHCHIYNATDWQVAGALRGPLANEIRDPAVQWMIKRLAGPVERICRSFSLSAASELKLLTAWEKLGKAEAIAQMESYIRDHQAWLAKQLARLLRGSALEHTINSMLDAGPTVFSANTHRKFGKEFLLDAFRHGPSHVQAGCSQQGQDPEGLASIPGLFVFLLHMMSPRFANYWKYQKDFTSGNGALGVDCCIAAMLDFDYWIGDDEHAESPLDDQLEVMRKISELSDAYVRPIVAYNPWTDIEDNDDSIRRVEKAVKEMGFVGVKIYPQLGYYPSGNAEQDYPKEGEHPDLRLLDDKLRHFFSVCRHLDVPVMAHSEESMGRFPSHKKLGSPRAWTVFFKAAENAGTRVNLAHFGGELGGGRGPWGWTRRFAELMVDPQAVNLYGDFGLWDELISGDDRARQRIISLLERPIWNGDTVADRMMFGTDWFMLTFTRPKPDYVIRFVEVLQQAGVEDEMLEKIFYRNARKLFEKTCKPL